MYITYLHLKNWRNFRDAEIHLAPRSYVARPDAIDKEDVQLLTETHLEQTLTNARFRELADFFSSVNCLHLVPQLLKYGDKIGGNRLEDDPFGQGFLERNSVPDRPEKGKAVGAPGMIRLYIATEDALSEAVADRLVAEVNQGQGLWNCLTP